MPIFEYYCPKCDFKFEKLVRNTSQNKNTVCPNCKNKKTVKLFSAFGFKSNGTFKPSSGSACGGCASSNCSTCG